MNKQKQTGNYYIVIEIGFLTNVIFNFWGFHRMILILLD